MLNISFILASLTSCLWFFYNLKYIDFSHLLTKGDIPVLFQATLILILPLLLIWMIYNIICNLKNEKNINLVTSFMAKQLKNNSDNALALQQAINSAEQEIKRGFILQKFDFLISDTNELLSDIIKRSNSVSSIQMEHLWERTSGGEHWLIAKTIIEINEYQTGFAEHLFQKAQKDNLLRGSILEFNARYKNLCLLLNQYDTQKTFYNMIEFGALGKVYQILSPIVNKLSAERNLPSQAQTLPIEETITPDTVTEKQPEFPSFLSTKPKAPTKEEKIIPINPQIPEETKTESAVKETTIISGFTATQNALRNLKTPFISTEDTTRKREKISLDDIEKEINASPENNYDEDEYPLEVLFDGKNNK